jgi:hypothetical protein
MSAARPPELTEPEAAARLASGEAWRSFCRALESAGEIILAHSPASDLDRAEGFRYLTRLSRMAFKLCLEHADPAAPRLIRYMDPTQKFGVDNPDQLYQWARVSGAYAYRLHGPRNTAAYVGIGVYAGSAGRGGRRTVAHLDTDELGTGPEGEIDVLLAPERPPRAGHWIQTTPDTTTLIVRHTMNDVERERPAALTLERLDAAGPPPPLSARDVVKGLERAARQVAGSARIFALLAERWRERPNQLWPMDERMARESFGDPDLYYSGGYWRLGEDEALVIDFTPPRCRYWGFLVCNFWTESLDYRYRPVATNGHRAARRADGSVRLVLAHRNPQLSGANWLDTEGHREGTMALRWLLAAATPVPEPRVVRFAELARLP